ncbi:MAG TPA: AAA family ATPase [Kofleriaceae bacterium]|nr:AAA family ATPase [Kofleriaceae bacterium]
MSRRALQRSRYSPGNLAPDVLERLFIGRSGLLDELIAKVSRSVLSKDKQHILLVGPRGSGKTHATALLHRRLKTDPKLAEARARAIIAYLNEEEWGVASFLDFILVILRSIQSEHGEVARGIALVEETFERDPDKARDLAEDTLRQVVKNKTLVLLCENLNDLFQAIGAEGQQRWRSLVQEQRSWCIVATAPSLFLQVSRQTEPFYGFFTIRSLEKLSLDDAIELLRCKAELEGRSELAAAIDTATGRARVRAIHHIVGGNHRAYIVLSEFLTRESLGELVSPFMNMVDDLTPYYQERTRNSTSPLQRKLVDYLCRQRRPATVRDIARATLVQQQSAAKQLGELAKFGIVQKTSRGRESFYEISEPLMRLCIEVKDKRTEYISVLVDLLRHWFSARELESRHQDPSARASFVDPIAGLWNELQQRGPSSFATQCVALLDQLTGVTGSRQELVSEALLAILHRLVRTRSSSSRHPEWADALAMMTSRMPGFEVLLQLFSVGVHYTATGDEGVLLDIPLEQRRLLLDAIVSGPK